MRWARQDVPVIIAAALLFTGIFVLRWAASDPADGISALYVLPVALLASRFGLRAGLAAGVLAFGLTVTWSLGSGVHLGALAVSSRLVTFLVAGLAVGVFADQIARSTAERGRLLVSSGEAVQRTARAEQVQALLGLLSRSATLEQVADAYLSEGLPLLGARQGAVFVDAEYAQESPTVRRGPSLGGADGRTAGAEPGKAPDRRLSLIAVLRPTPATREWDTISLSERMPPADAARHGRFIFCRNAREIAAAYPHLARIRAESGDQAWAAGPLTGSTGTIGAIVAAFAEPQLFDQARRDLFGTVADRVAEAMERARLLEVANAERARAEAARQRASLLADVGAVLTAAWGPAERMQRLLTTLVPAFADMGSVEALHGDRLELLAAAHSDPASLPALERQRRSVPDARGDRLLGRAILLGRPELVTLPGGPSPLEAGAGAAALRATSALAVPLRARGKVIGGLLLQHSQSGRRFDEADLALAELIAGRAALALDNAALYEQQVEAVTALQHVLLPGSLPRIEGVAATARYRPGMATLDVGGDWYDVITLPEQRVGIVLGDVVGRGVTAAATMGQLRSAVAAVAPYSAGPVEVLERLDRFAGTISRATLATIAYADYAPATGVLRYACAGHLPPLLITDRQVRFLDAGRGVPLATGADVGWTQAQVQIRREGTLICYSDGLVERRGIDLDDRLRELAAAATDLAGNPLTRLCERLLERMIGQQPLGDDVALLCVELQRVPAARFHQIVPAHRSQLAPLRAELRAWGAAAGVQQPVLGDLLLAVGEACANAIEHAYLGDRPVAEIEVSVEIDSHGTVAARVSDTGRWRDQPHGLPNRGRGLALVRATMPEVHVESWSSGTTVTMRRPGATQRASAAG